MLSSAGRHVLHCLFLFGFIVYFEIITGAINIKNEEELASPEYGIILTLVLYFVRILLLLPLPQAIFNFCGLVLYNAFPDKPKMKGSPLLAPFICFRVVTRGDYPELVRSNVLRNVAKCGEAGVENFMIEVVTDKAMELPWNPRVRQIVVPSTYKTRSGALYKARALQYSLENGVSMVCDNDWIVHLDEETLLTVNCINGIVNFVLEAKHDFGQGVITYANEGVVNWLTTLADTFRVADDFGKLRFQLKHFHKPLFSWKGSYVVSKVSAEKQVTFDNGVDGSVAEDCYFALKAFQMGYSFDFIEGEMWEKSPFTLYDFLQQRKRWLQGIYLVVKSKQFDMYHKFFLCLSFYSWATLPLSTSNMYLTNLYPIQMPFLIDFLCAFVGAVNIYLYIFGVIKSFSVYRFGVVKSVLCVVATLCIIPLNMVIENVAVIWGLATAKHKFYIVNKNVLPVLDV